MRNRIVLFCCCFLWTCSLSAADYYWIGGAGDWSNISNWATTSGGFVTHSQAPTAIDNVFFDANSFTGPNQFVIINIDNAFCRNMTWTDDVQGAILTGSTLRVLNVFGSIQLGASMQFDFQGDVLFQGSNQGNVIDMQGHNFARNITFDGLGGSWTLSGPINVDSLFIFEEGDLNTNSFPVVCERLRIETLNAQSRVDLSNSVITVTGIDIPTFLPYYQTVYISGGSPGVFSMEDATFQINGSSVTFANFIANDPLRIGRILLTSEFGKSILTALNTNFIPYDVGYLNIQNNSRLEKNMKIDSLVLGGGKSFEFQSGLNFDITYLEVEGSCTEPVQMTSTAARQATTIRSDVANIVADYVTLRDVHAMGNANFVANNSVDIGNNLGWTINEKNYSELYWVGGTGMWDDPAHWSFTSGGPGGACIPTPGEDVIFDANSFNNLMDLVQVNVENAYCKDMSWIGAANRPVFSGDEFKNLRIFGSLLLDAGMEYNYVGRIFFESQDTAQTITTGNHALLNDVHFSGAGGWILQDDFVTNQDLYLEAGSLNTNDQFVQMRRFFSDYDNQRALYLNSSTFQLIDTITYFWLRLNLETTNLDFDEGTSTINFLGTGSSYFIGDQAISLHNLRMNGGGDIEQYIEPRYALEIDTFEVDFTMRMDNNFYPKTLIINAGYEFFIEEADTLSFDTMIINGDCTLQAELKSRFRDDLVYINPSKENTVNNMIIRDVINYSTNQFIANSSTDLGNNTNIDFSQTPGRDLYWVGDGGDWTDRVHWSLASGGPGGECPPGPNDNVYFDENSFSGDGQLVSVGSYSYSKDLIWTTPRNTTFNFFRHQLFGDLLFTDNMEISRTLIRLRSDSLNQTINSAGLLFGEVYVDGKGSWLLTDSLNTRFFNFESGTFILNGQSVSSISVFIFTDSPKTLDTRNSYWRFDGDASLFTSWLVQAGSSINTLSDNSEVEFTQAFPQLNIYEPFSFGKMFFSSLTGTSEIQHWIQEAGDTIRYDEMIINNNASFLGRWWGDTLIVSPGKSYELDFEGILRADEYIQILGNNCAPIQLFSNASGTQATFSSYGAILKADFIQMRDILAVGDIEFFAGVRSTDISNNTNWIFDSVEEFIDEGFLGPDQVLCNVSSLTLDANNFSPGETYLWQDGSTDSTFVVNQPGLFVAEVTFTNNCVIRDSVQVLPQQDFMAALPDTVSIVCAGDSLELDAGLDLVGLRYVWQDSSRSSTFQVDAPGEYKVSIELSGCTSSDSTQVRYVDFPSFNLGMDSTLCADSTYTLNALTDTASYRWQDGSTAPTFQVMSPGIYWVDVSYDKCATRDSIQIDYYAPIPLDLGQDTTICDETNITLAPRIAGANYLWSDNSTGEDLTVNQAGAYTVEATLNACTVRDTIQIAIQELPRVELGEDVEICEGESFLIDGTSLPGTTYEWSDGSTMPTLAVSNAGFYALQATLNNCTFADTKSVNVKPLPQVDLGMDQELCEEDVLILDVSQTGATYLWQDNTTEGTLTVENDGTYRVNVDLNGCQVSDTINVIFNPLPRFDLGADEAFCEGSSLSLDGTTLAGATYEWSDGSTNPTLSVSTAGIFALQTELNGCTFSGAKEVSIKPLPIVELGAGRTLCDGEVATLDVRQDNATYLWQDGSTEGTFTVSQNGTFNVFVDLNGCFGTDTVTYNFTSLPSFELGNDTLLCEGENLSLDGTVMGAAYTWSTGSTSPSITIDQAGTYSLTTSRDACTFTDEIIVQYGIIPDDLLGDDQIRCDGEEINFALNVPGANYAWIGGSNSSAFTITQAGTYGVRVNVDRCIGGDTINVSYNPLPVFNLGNDTLLCEGDQLNLSIDIMADTYQWQDGSTQQSLTVGIPGVVMATATLDNCSFTDELLVDYQVSRPFSLGPDTTICEEEPLVLSVNSSASRIRWQDGSSQRTFTVRQAGTYAVEVEDGACTFSDSIQIDTRECFRFRVFRPSAFSPDGDGVNDQFLVGIPPNMQILEYEMRIFDRWGNLVYTNQDINQGWDGIFNGDPADTGIYVFSVRIKYRDDFREDEEIFTGDVLLLR